MGIIKSKIAKRSIMSMKHEIEVDEEKGA